VELVLDESVDARIAEKVAGRDVTIWRPAAGIPDQAVLEFAIRHTAPLLTRDQGDFISLDRELTHYGILIDKKLHLRQNRELVAETIVGILDHHQAHLENTVLFVSDFYGRF